MAAGDRTEARRGGGDREAILAAAADYIEAWLDGDAERMAGCLHPQLVKRSPADGPRRAGEIESMTREDMIAATAKGLGTRHRRPWRAAVLDVHRDIAAVRVRSVPYVDYLQLVRTADRWLIVNVLWQRRNEP